ncbi:MAG: FAD-dependent oxidoreductase [Solirubrobacterales bacterium]|nr:FAD-dependent oxidoreductase [Solirubrobacterales bacterium]
MASPKRFDLLVLGGGTGGLVSAQIAAGIGARVALVEQERTGGDCLWTGCVPSKSLLAAAELAHAMRHADKLGLTPHEAPVDLAKVMEHVQAAQATIAPQDSPERLRNAGVEVYEGHGAFVAPGELRVGGETLRFRSAILATGSAPVLPPVDGLEGIEPLTTDSVWGLRELPERLVVVGGGPIGCELGQAFARLGSRVSIVDVADRVLTKEEPEASQVVAESLRADGVELRLGASLSAARREGEEVVLTLEDGEELRADRVLVAAGRKPRTEGFGLELIGVETDDRGAVQTDATMRTANRRVFAVGDVVATLPFTHAAAHHARVATLNALFGLRRSAEKATIPWVTFTDPEVAHVGMTEAQAREEWGDDITLARAGFDELDRAITAGATTGFALLVGDDKRRLVGATIVGRGAGESIAELTAWISQGEKIDVVSNTVHAYPTFAEAAARAADQHLRERFNTPGIRRAVAPVLALARMLPRRA